MKKLFLIIFLLLSFECFGGNNGTLKFLGIPIDGSETQFSVKLRQKGFVYDSLLDCHFGQFNGLDVDVYLHTNHNLMDRVCVVFPYMSEREVRNLYNTLLREFNDSGKYLDFGFNCEIPSNEDIAYEIAVNKKWYGCSFSYIDPERDQGEFLRSLLNSLDGYLTKEQAEKLNAYGEAIIQMSREELAAVISGINPELLASQVDPGYVFALLDAVRSIADGDVWFAIVDKSAGFKICLYYDNLHNRPHGEDL